MNEIMIRSFKSKETEKVWNRQYSKKFPTEIQQLARRKLIALNVADGLQDLRIPPGNRLEKLSGNRDGQYSIRINDQRRICFKWVEGEVDNIEIVDYH